MIAKKLYNVLLLLGILVLAFDSYAQDGSKSSGSTNSTVPDSIPKPSNKPLPNETRPYIPSVEKHNTGWAFYLDNDLLTTGKYVDRDYTGGFALTLSGHRATTYLFSLDKYLNKLDKFTRFEKLYASKDHFQLHSIEFGLTLFTPRNIATSEPIENDHPYASLLFMANTQQTVIPEQGISYQSTLTVGLLGLGVGEYLQKGIHSAFNGIEPNGWTHQISDGGEPTAKYTVSVQKTHLKKYNRRGIGYEFKSSIEANVGFSTDSNLGILYRWGRINTYWWSFNPHQAEYINLGSPVVAEPEGRNPNEFYVWTGANIRYRIYNVILQGQFRDSDVTFSRSDLKHLIGEVWVGVTKQVSSEYRFSFVIRKRTGEVKGPNARKPVWGAIILSKAL